ncbi:tonsoku-like protein isoform X2 [Gigantopelta aegis]|uniref:tonsoku-like protein isoform X2 n=1 Tax=Gigantopelta aegis TaxID=1735272 RepID=UPI001B8874B1|nr:tonsoku-like protein isoform X2 [Gigantopelta aegis]
MDTADEHELERLRRDKRKEEKKNNLREVAQICNCIGELLSKYGRYEDAITEHEAERALSEVLQDTIGEAVACRKIGECYCFLEQFSKALQLQQRHLSLARSCDNVLEEQRALATIGRTYLCQSESVGNCSQDTLRKAENAFLEAAEVCERLKSGIKNEEYQEMKARLFLNLGLVHDAKGDVRQSSEYMKRAITIAEKYKLWSDLYRCQFSLACMYQRSGNFSSALRFLEGAHKSTKILKDKLLEAECLTQKSQILIEVGDFAGAKHSLKRAYKLGTAMSESRVRILHFFKAASKLEEKSHDLDSADVRVQLKAFESMGDAAAEITNYKQAIQYYLKMLKCAQDLNVSNRELIPIYVSLAQTYLDDKQPSVAINYFIKETECRPDDYEQVCRTWLNIADAQEQQGLGYDKISKSFLTALDNAKKAKHRKLQVRVLKSLIETQKAFKQERHQAQTEDKLSKLRQKYGLDLDDEFSDEETSTQLSEDEGNLSITELTDSDESDEETGNARQVRGVCLKRRTQTNFKRNEKGETPLHRACIAGNLKQVKKLLDQGHPVNPRDYCGWLPLHEASNFDFSDIVELLLDHGAAIDDRGGEGCGGITPLMDAGSSGSLNVMEVLIKHGANLWAKDEEGQTALDCVRAWYDRVEDTLTREVKVHYQHIVELMSQTRKGNINVKLSKSCSAKSKVPMVRSKPALVLDDEDLSVSPSLPDVTFHKRKSRESGDTVTRNEIGDHCSLLDEDSGDIYVNPHLEGHNSDRETATTVYRDAIKSVGSSALRPTHRASISTKPHTSEISSLLTEDKIVGDDWLIEDIKSSTKRKRVDVDGFFSADRLRNVDPDDVKAKKRKSSNNDAVSSDSRVETEVERCDIQDYDSEPDVMRGVRHEDHIDVDRLTDLERVSASDSESSVNDLQLGSVDSLSRSTQKKWTVKKKHKQLKLTSFGTSQKRNVVNTETSSNLMGVSFTNGSIPVEADVGRIGQSQIVTFAGCLMRLRVKVMDKTFLIPVPRSEDMKTISWLSQEAAHRYYCQCGRRPLLTLSTKDDAILSADDVIGMVLSNNEELVAEVDSWDLPALQDRYSQACKALRAVHYRNISTILEICDNTGSLSLKDLALRPGQIQPVFRALQGQTNLTHLNLQGNRLSDVGMESLCKSLEAVPSLTDLDLACNGITSLGLKYLADLLEAKGAGDQSKPLQLLLRLNLSSNPLGDSSMESFVRMVANLPSLTSIALSSCRLTVKLFSQHRVALSQALRASKLTSLDVSYNKLGSLGLELLLKCLNPTTISTLNLCEIHTGSNISHLSLHLQQYITQEGCHLEDLNLSGNHLSPDDAYFSCKNSIVAEENKESVLLNES